VKKIAVRFAISLVVAIILLWWVKKEGISIIPPAEHFSEISWWAIPVYVISLFGVHFFRAYRVDYLIKPLAKVSLRKLILLNFASFLAIMILPLRTGEFVRPYLFKKEAGISMSAGMGIVAIERIIDGLIVSFWLTIALFTIPGSSNKYVVYLRFIPLSIFATGLLFLILMIVFDEKMRKFVSWFASFSGHRMKNFALHVYDGFLNGLRTLPRKSTILGFLVYSLIYWGINALGVWGLAIGCKLGIGIEGAVAVVGILAVGIMLPTGPGYFGNFQASVLIALSIFLDQSSIRTSGEAFIFILFVCQGGIHVLAGLIGLIDFRSSLKGIVTAPESLEEWEDVP